MLGGVFKVTGQLFLCIAHDTNMLGTVLEIMLIELGRIYAIRYFRFVDVSENTERIINVLSTVDTV